jgi:hypothetical protein
LPSAQEDGLKQKLLEELHTTPPASQELPPLFELARSMKQKGTTEGATRLMNHLLQRAVEQAAPRLTAKAEIEEALGYATGQVHLQLAERGAQLYPEHLAFISARYQTALALGLPASYFSDAESEISRLLAQGKPLTEKGTKRSSPGSSTEGAHPLRTLMESRGEKEVAADERQASGAPQGKGRKGSRKKAEREEEEAQLAEDFLLELAKHLTPGNPLFEGMQQKLAKDQEREQLQRLKQRIKTYRSKHP